MAGPLAGLLANQKHQDHNRNGFDAVGNLASVRRQRRLAIMTKSMATTVAWSGKTSLKGDRRALTRLRDLAGRVSRLSKRTQPAM